MRRACILSHNRNLPIRPGPATGLPYASCRKTQHISTRQVSLHPAFGFLLPAGTENGKTDQTTPAPSPGEHGILRLARGKIFSPGLPTLISINIIADASLQGTLTYLHLNYLACSSIHSSLLMPNRSHRSPLNSAASCISPIPLRMATFLDL